MATSLAAVGGIVFGAGPIIARTELDASHWPVGRIALAVLAAVIGVLGLVLVIAATVNVLIPVELTLATIPKGFVDVVNQDPESYLPSDCPNVAVFRKRLQASLTAAARLPAQIAAETNQQNKVALRAALKVVRQNVVIYKRARAVLLAQAGFFTVSSTFRSRKWKIGFGAVLAVAGAVVYLLLVSGKATDEPEAVTPPVLARLTAHSDGTSTALWSSLNLGDCEVPARSGNVFVLKLKGAGSTADPYQVQTIDTSPACPVRTFSVIDEVATLSVPKATDVKITYSPAPKEP